MTAPNAVELSGSKGGKGRPAKAVKGAKPRRKPPASKTAVEPEIEPETVEKKVESITSQSKPKRAMKPRLTRSAGGTPGSESGPMQEPVASKTGKRAQKRQLASKDEARLILWSVPKRADSPEKLVRAATSMVGMTQPDHDTRQPQ